MRKWIWMTCILALCAAVGFYLTSVYVHRNPTSPVSRGVVGVYRWTTAANPLVRFSHELCAGTASAVKQKLGKPAPVATDADKPYVVESPEFQRSIGDIVRRELPPVQQLGTVTIPEDGIYPDAVCPQLEVGGEELAEWLPMEPLPGESTAPLTMPYLGEITFSYVNRLLETNYEDFGGAEECEPPVADLIQDVIVPICPAPSYDHIYHHGGCTQPMVCPYSGKCSTPALPIKAGLGEKNEDAMGEELAEPKDEPREESKDDAGATDPVCPDHHPHDSMYHSNHGSPRMVVCPYSGKSYPVDDEPCEPKATEPDIAAEEEQEVKPAEEKKPEKKQEMEKKRKVRHKLWLLFNFDPTQREGGDTLEFRPNDANPNDFGLIPF